MYILDNVPLSGYSTMRLGGVAAHLTEINNQNELSEALSWARERQLPVIMIGGGSNIIWQDSGFPGLVLVNKISGYESFAEDETNYYITVGAGEVWDSVVERTVQEGLSGIEFLSLIPGSTGATPIQNVGAYGAEIANVLVSVTAYDTQASKLVTIPASDCQFGYRTSRFKTNDKGRFFITAITLHLMHTNPTPPFYAALESYFSEHTITSHTPQTVRDAVIAIRNSKLPDPAVVANNGSFFANPFVDQPTLTQLQADHPGIMYWQTNDNRYKLAAGWLVEQAGFKGAHDPETGMATWPAQALVLVNEHAKTTADLLKFRQKIIDTVQQMFGVTLEQEPELLP